MLIRVINYEGSLRRIVNKIKTMELPSLIIFKIRTILMYEPKQIITRILANYTNCVDENV